MGQLRFDWFVPTNGGDGYDVVGGGHGVDAGAASRPPSLGYLGQVARSAEQLGFEAALVPTGAWCEDAWLTASMLSQTTQRLDYLVALRPGLTSPTLAAQMVSTFQRFTGGRLRLNVVVGGESHEQRSFGDFLAKDERYERCGEFLDVLASLLAGETVTFDGRHIQVENARLHELAPSAPEVYFGGSSVPALEVAARHADVYLTWGEPPAAVAEKVKAVSALAERQGRTLRFGLRAHTIVRETADQAWAEADRLLANIDAETITAMQQGLSASESEGQQRMLALHGGSKERLEIHPGLWAGVGLVRGGAGTAFVGDARSVADLIEEYHDVGIDEFILSAYPHLEGAYWFGERVLPELERRGLWKAPEVVL